MENKMCIKCEFAKIGSNSFQCSKHKSLDSDEIYCNGFSLKINSPKGDKTLTNGKIKRTYESSIGMIIGGLIYYYYHWHFSFLGSILYYFVAALLGSIIINSLYILYERIKK